MKPILALFIFFSLLATTQAAQGTEVLWLSLKPSFSYRDLSTVCSNKYYPTTLYFGAEVEGLEIKKAVFRDSLSSFSSKITLTAEEIEKLELYKDKDGQLWLKTVPMKGRLLTWMFFEAGGGAFSPCKPTQPLATIDPASFSYQFEVEKPIEGAESNLGKFQGKLKDGAAYQLELQFSEKPYRFFQIDQDLQILGEATDDTFIEEELRAYPKPPWTRSASAWGNGPNRFSAQSLCQSDARSKSRSLESTCRTNGGSPSSSHPFCSICNQLGSQWRCSETVRVNCSGHLEDAVEDSEEISSPRLGSPVFSDRQDCRAIAMGNPGLCRNRDCRGVLYHAQTYCQSNDCRAMTLGLVSYCQSRDCRAILYNNVGFCESANCRAVLYKNFGMCR